jgi:S-formylglutathione hydrolase FrmB
MKLEHFEVVTEEVELPSLRGNPAGDPSVRDIGLVIPRKALEAAGERCPVVYILAGYTGTGPMMLNRRSWTPSFPAQIDRLRARGEIGDMIFVLPDFFTIYGGSQYLNSSATGRYRDALTEDLIPWIDRRLPTLPGPRHRAVGGKSSGGYGAIVLAMERPGLFAAVACHSGDMYFEYCYLPDFPKLLEKIGKHGSIEAFVEAFLAAPKKTPEDIMALNILAMAAAYSPNPMKPWRADLPFDPKTGAIDEEVWRRWLEKDPVRMVEKGADALKAMRLVFLDCGSRDQFNLQYGLRTLSERLSGKGVPHTALEFDDNHSDTSYRFDVSLPKIWEAIRP